MLPDITIKDIFSIAIKLENDGDSFYREMASKTKNKEGKEMFLRLATEEEEHKTKLLSKYNDIAKKGERVTIDKIDELSMTIEATNLLNNIFSDKGSFLRDKKVWTTDLDALLIAIKNENNSIDCYLKLNEIASNPLVDDVFSELIQYEREHLSTLQRHYDYLNKTGEWLMGGDE